jgi:hypothetical protein
MGDGAALLAVVAAIAGVLCLIAWFLYNDRR